MAKRNYLDGADDEVLAIGVIEHIDAVETAAEVVSTPGLDVVFIGPGDLATSRAFAVAATIPMFKLRLHGSSGLFKEARSCLVVSQRTLSRQKR